MTARLFNMLEIDVHLRLDQFRLSAALALDKPVTAFFGPAGSGKSALLGVIAGTENPQRGWIRLGGETLLDTRAGVRIPGHRRRIALVGSRPPRYPYHSVRAQLISACERVGQPFDASRFDRIVGLLELADVLDCPTREAPPELGQRIALGDALMGAPRLLLLDSPSGRPGQPSRLDVMPFLSRVWDELKTPLIYVGSTLGEVLQLTREMVLLANGRVLAVGDVHQIVTDRVLLAGTAQQGVENVLPVTIIDHDVECGCTLANYYGIELVLPIMPDLPRGASARISVRSGNIALSKRYLEGVSIQNQIKGRVCAVIRNPKHALVQIDCGDTLLVGISLLALRDMDLQEGDSVYCLIKAQAFSYIEEGLPAGAGALLASWVGLRTETRH